MICGMKFVDWVLHKVTTGQRQLGEVRQKIGEKILTFAFISPCYQIISTFPKLHIEWRRSSVGQETDTLALQANRINASSNKTCVKQQIQQYPNQLSPYPYSKHRSVPSMFWRLSRP